VINRREGQLVAQVSNFAGQWPQCSRLSTELAFDPGVALECVVNLETRANGVRGKTTDPRSQRHDSWWDKRASTERLEQRRACALHLRTAGNDPGQLL
jgi:hypothetical protein